MSNKIKLDKNIPVVGRVDKATLVAMLTTLEAIEAGTLDIEFPCTLTGAGLEAATKVRRAGFKPTDEEWDIATAFIRAGDFHHYINRGLLLAKVKRGTNVKK